MSGLSFGEIPRFVEELAYLRGLNVGITIGLQSLSQLKKKYKDSWESVLDCVDSILYLGSNSKETLEYIRFCASEKKLGIKNQLEEHSQGKVLHQLIGMLLEGN